MRVATRGQTVAQARLEMAEHNLAEMRRMYDALLEKYHALATLQPAQPVQPSTSVIDFPEPELPPDEVLAAIQQISPVRDKTYEANWAHWEKHKAKAKAHPKAFAEEIIEGVPFERAS